MSTNKTQNYNLHSWLPQDEFHVSEINENFTKLDQELALETETLQDTFADEVAGIKTTLAGKADKSEVAKKAEFIMGSYSGTSNFQRIELGFKPLFLHIEQEHGGRELNVCWGGVAVPELALTSWITFEDTAFTVAPTDHLNHRGHRYIYLAYRE